MLARDEDRRGEIVDHEDDVLTAQEAAAVLRVSRSKLYEMVKQREIGSTKVGKRGVRLTRAHIAEYLADHQSVPRSALD